MSGKPNPVVCRGWHKLNWSYPVFTKIGQCDFHTSSCVHKDGQTEISIKTPILESYLQECIERYDKANALLLSGSEGDRDNEGKTPSDIIYEFGPVVTRMKEYNIKLKEENELGLMAKGML